jgi:type IV secretion system protein TrbC
MFKGNFPGMALALLLFVSLAMFAGFASASTASSGGSSLPVVSVLQQIRDLITGPFAYTLSIVSLVAGCAGLLFGGNDMGAFVRFLLYFACVVSFIVFAVNTMSTLFSGALIPELLVVQ